MTPELATLMYVQDELFAHAQQRIAELCAENMDLRAENAKLRATIEAMDGRAAIFAPSHDVEDLCEDESFDPEEGDK